MLDPRSAMARPTTKIQAEARNQPQTSPTGPAGTENDKVLAIEGSKPIIANAIPKTSIMLKLRRSSCLYLVKSISAQYNLRPYGRMYTNPIFASTAASSSLARFVSTTKEPRRLDGALVSAPSGIASFESATILFSRYDGTQSKSR